MEMEKSKEKTNNSEENKVEKNNDFSKMDSTTKSIMEQQASFKSTDPVEESDDDTITKPKENFIKKVIKNITIEPAMFVISLAVMLDGVSYGQMVLEKSCKVDFGFNDTVCDNLVHDFKEENELVQNEVAQFNVYASLLESIFPAFFAFYMGAWCDMFGRKLILYLYFTCTILKQICVIICAYFLESPKEYLLFAGIPESLAGGKAAFFLAINAFMSDITEPEYRAFRFGMLHLISGLARPIGAPIGAQLYKHGGYICVFATSLGGIILGAFYLIFRIQKYKWTPSKDAKKRGTFSPLLIKDSFVSLFRWRQGKNRSYMFALIALTTFLILPFAAEHAISYNYVRTRYEWEVMEYSNYRSIVSAVGLAAQAVFIPLVTLLKFNEALMMICVFSLSMIRHILTAFAYESWMYYTAAMLDLMEHYAMSIVRSMLSCCVPADELGKIYAAVSSIESLIPVAVAQLYVSVWQETSEIFPGAVYMISAGFGLLTVLLSFYLYKSLKGETMAEATAMGAGRVKDSKPVELFDTFRLSRI